MPPNNPPQTKRTALRLLSSIEPSRPTVDFRQLPQTQVPCAGNWLLKPHRFHKNPMDDFGHILCMQDAVIRPDARVPFHNVAEFITVLIESLVIPFCGLTFWQSTSTNQFGISDDGSIMEFTTVNAAQEVVIRITLRTGRMDQNPMRFASRQ